MGLESKDYERLQFLPNLKIESIPLYAVFATTTKINYKLTKYFSQLNIDLEILNLKF